MIGRTVVSGPFFTLPNAISLARIPLAIAAVACYAADLRLTAQLLIVASFLTDALDGYVARLTGSISEWGRILDPMADKVVFAVLGVSFAALGVIPWWLVAALVGRDGLIAVGGLLHMGRIGEVPRSNLLGKLSTALMATYLFKQAFWPARELALGLDWLGWVAVTALLVSTLAYVAVYVRHEDEDDQPASENDASP